MNSGLAPLKHPNEEQTKYLPLSTCALQLLSPVPVHTWNRPAVAVSVSFIVKVIHSLVTKHARYRPKAIYVTISCTASALQNILLHSIVLSHYSCLRYTTKSIYATVSLSPATKLLYIPFFSPITPAYDRPQKLFMLYIPPFFLSHYFRLHNDTYFLTL